MTRSPLDHEEAARRARTYADRTTRRTARLTGKQGPPTPWVVLYLHRYRWLTMRPRNAGPPPVWLPAERRKP